MNQGFEPPLKLVAPWTRRIIIINVVVALLGEWAGWGGGVNVVREWLPFRLSDFISGSYWQVFTYMWVHAELYGALTLHLIFNMMTLYFIGKVVEFRMGSGRFLAVYVAGGIAAVGFFLIEAGLRWSLTGGGVDVDQALVGASGAVCAILGAFAVFAPDARVYILFLPFPVRAARAVAGFAVVSVILVILGLWPGVADSESYGWLFSIAHSAHLGGLALGWWVSRSWSKPRFCGSTTSFQVIQGPGVPPPLPTGLSPEELERILSKWSRSGVESLTLEERDLLNRIDRLRTF